MGRIKDKPSTRKSPLRRPPRKHGSEEPKKTTKKAKAAIEPDLGTIPWASNEGALIWSLLDQLQVPDNRLVLFGKKPGTTENTKGDSKIIVYKRIGQAILPELYKTSPNNLGKRVKAKAEDLVKSYKTHAKKLQVTGGGLQNDQDEDNDGENVHEFLECYISPDGPDHDTSERAKNLWEEITKKFPYFPEMHKFLSARSNITPPAVTTGVGPQGRKIIHLQAPGAPKNTPNVESGTNINDYATIDPLLRPSPTPPTSPEHDDGPSSPIVIDSSPLADVKRGGKTATMVSSFEQAFSKANGLCPSKTSFEDKLVDLQTTMFKNANRREDVKLRLEETRLEQEATRLRLQETNQIMELADRGILDADAARERLAILRETYSREPVRKCARLSEAEESEPGPSKRHHSHSSASRHHSHNSWDSRGNSPPPGSDRSLGYH